MAFLNCSQNVFTICGIEVICKMNEDKLQKFKSLFSDYCRCEINKGNCCDGDCEFCSVNNAYEIIFEKKNQENDCD